MSDKAVPETYPWGTPRRWLLPEIETWSPLPELGKWSVPLPSLVGPLKPEYRSRSAPNGFPVFRLPKAGHMNASWLPVKVELNPVKSIAPLPVATTSGPTCCSVTI